MTGTAPAKDSQHLVRERFYDNRSDILSLVNLLHINKSTGELRIFFSSGGLRSAMFVEKVLITFEDRTPGKPTLVSAPEPESSDPITNLLDTFSNIAP